MVESPVGYRCQACSAGARVSAYRPSSIGVFKALGIGVVVASGIGFLWGNYPSWGFYLALIMGFGTVEAMAKVSNYKRGQSLQIAAYGSILLGLFVSRYTLMTVNPENFPVELSLQLLLENADQDIIRRAFYLRLIPDFLFMAIPFVIAYIRFR